MNKQSTFSDLEYNSRNMVSRREIFLDKMDAIICWPKWVEMITPYYYDGKRGRPPIGIEPMLRMYLLQTWYSLSDEGVEEAIYDSYAFRKFMGVDFMSKRQVPDATTLLKFRHILEDHEIGDLILKYIVEELGDRGEIYKGGTIVDATIIEAPKSTKNEECARDPEMSSTKKSNVWHFGCKLHIGVDAATGMVHSFELTTAKVHDVNEAHNLIRPTDEVLYGDSGYLGLDKRPEIMNSPTMSQIDFKINKRPSQLKTPKTYKGINWDKLIEHRKSSVRCKVEHVMQITKHLFGFRKAPYKGLAKNRNRVAMLMASVNLVLYGRTGRGVPI